MPRETPRSRQNFSEKCEALINKLINIELCAFHQYLALGAFYDRQEVALECFAKYFRGSAERSKDNANMLIDYQNLRGGEIQLCQISTPNAREWQKPTAAFEFVLKMEKDINEELLNIRKTAREKGDSHLSYFLGNKMIREQYKVIDEVTRMLTNLIRVGDGLELYVLDKELHSHM